MSENSTSDQISGDKVFLKRNWVFPMTAFFIALPIKKEANTTELNVGNGINERLVVNTAKKVGDGGTMMSTAPFPSGMGARRILLYIFAHRFAQPNQILRLNEDSNNAFLRKLGYNFGRTAMSSHPGIVGLKSLIPCRYQLGSEDINEEIGLGKLMTNSYNLRYGRLSNQLLLKRKSLILEVKRRTTAELFKQKYEAYFAKFTSEEDVFLHPFFAFDTALPFKYSCVMGSTKKSEFWNVFVFLVDLLPRIKKGKSLPIPWKEVYALFQKRYGDDGESPFKHFFKQTLNDVFEIYPNAKGRVDTGDKVNLILKHAPPPV
ncbi:MAG: hypothetical protein K6L76_01730 [Agarilytica sp.]